MVTCSPDQAREIAAGVLSRVLPFRWFHSDGVARQAEAIAAVVGGPEQALSLCSAAWLHDIGYAPSLVKTGFHAVDGANFLRSLGFVDHATVNLVAHHSCASVEARLRGVERQLGEFEVPDVLMSDALLYCDMTTGPRGSRVSIDERLTEIVERHGTASIAGQFVSLAEGELRAAYGRVVERLVIGQVHPLADVGEVGASEAVSDPQGH